MPAGEGKPGAADVGLAGAHWANDSPGVAPSNAHHGYNGQPLAFQPAAITLQRSRSYGNKPGNMNRRNGKRNQSAGPYHHNDNPAGNGHGDHQHPQGSGASSNGNGGGGGHVLKRELYKTEMCKSFETHGTCRYAEKCQFAHGREQLRVTRRHPKYKSRRCRNFAVHGTCDYGSRCMFLHEMGPSGSASVSPGPGPVQPSTRAQQQPHQPQQQQPPPAQPRSQRHFQQPHQAAPRGPPSQPGLQVPVMQPSTAAAGQSWQDLDQGAAFSTVGDDLGGRMPLAPNGTVVDYAWGWNDSHSGNNAHEIQQPEFLLRSPSQLPAPSTGLLSLGSSSPADAPLTGSNGLSTNPSPGSALPIPIALHSPLQDDRDAGVHAPETSAESSSTVADGPDLTQPPPNVWGRPGSRSFDQQLPDSTDSVIKALLSSSPGSAADGGFLSSLAAREARGENPRRPWMSSNLPTAVNDDT